MYLSVNEDLRRRFGCKVYKLSIDGGFSCPNRDGTLGYGGCIFCGADGSGAFAQTGETVYQQIEDAKADMKRHNDKFKADMKREGKYIEDDMNCCQGNCKK